MKCNRCNQQLGEQDAQVLACTRCLGDQAHRISALEVRVQQLQGECDGLRAERETLIERLAIAEVQQ